MVNRTVSEVETEIARLLDQVTQIQSNLLEILRAKRVAMMKGDIQEQRRLLSEEANIYESLSRVNQERSVILEHAHSAGLEGSTLKDVSRRLPEPRGTELSKRIGEAGKVAQTLRLEQLTNWVADQQCLLHVSHLLEIIATGGRLRPTYGKSEYGVRGSLLDHEA